MRLTKAHLLRPRCPGKSRKSQISPICSQERLPSVRELSRCSDSSGLGLARPHFKGVAAGIWQVQWPAAHEPVSSCPSSSDGHWDKPSASGQTRDSGLDFAPARPLSGHWPWLGARHRTLQSDPERPRSSDWSSETLGTARDLSGPAKNRPASPCGPLRTGPDSSDRHLSGPERAWPAAHKPLGSVARPADSRPPAAGSWPSRSLTSPNGSSQPLRWPLGLARQPSGAAQNPDFPVQNGVSGVRMSPHRLPMKPR